MSKGLRASDTPGGNKLAGKHMVPQIAYHEKEVWNIYELFHTRFNLHKRAYQHRVAHAVEKMLCDALLHVERSGLFWLAGVDGKKVSLSHAMDDLEAYTHLNDRFSTRSVCRALVLLNPGAARGSGRPLSCLIALKSVGYRHVSEILVPVNAENAIGSERPSWRKF